MGVVHEHTTEPVARPLDAVQEFLSEHYIEAQTSLVGRSLRTLKEGDAFAVLDRYGDLGLLHDGPEGVFFRDTRYLSRYELRFEGRRPLLLGSVIQDDNASLTVDLTNPDIRLEEEGAIPRDIIAIDRTKFLWKAACYERIGLRNYDAHRRSFEIELRYDADFHDLFEARGAKRPRRGQRSVAVLGRESVLFRYDGLDGSTRRTTIHFEPAPGRIEPYSARFSITLEPGERCSIIVIVDCQEEERGEPANFLIAYRDIRRRLRSEAAAITVVKSSNDLFDEVAARSTSDLAMLVTTTWRGRYPYAGIPWYSTVFGRDGIITAMLLLWNDPVVAKGVLTYLAAMQAQTIDAAADAQPGKILHERRQGEMARLGEVPFRQYYGTVDATPLFVMLAGLYFERTGDRETIEAIWPNIRAALAWCDDYGDADRDGFVEYFRQTEEGLANQGWKDSHDAIFHADGSLAEGPIALCEVQGYVYAAKRLAADIAAALGDGEFATRLRAAAEMLKARFEEAFWCPDIGTYALALDGAKQQCRVRSSNAGHALFTGIADSGHAAIVAETLMSTEAFSGWGIRTIASGEPRYNPMSYHNGSVWPHDNAMIAIGLAHYGHRAKAARIFSAIFDAAGYQDLRRLPELFCGFIRRPRRGPTAYPVACSPQAWAAAAPFGMLGACLGLRLDHRANEVSFTDPMLPAFLNDVTLRGLHLGRSQFDIRVHRHEHDVTINVLARSGDARVTLSK